MADDALKRRLDQVAPNDGKGASADLSREVWGEKPKKAESIDIRSEKDFDDLIKNAKGPVLVKFGTEWCGPCRQMKPTMAKLEKDFEGRATVLTIDVNQGAGFPVRNGWALDRFGIKGIPHVMMFNNGKEEILNTRDPKILADKLDAEIKKSATKPSDKKDQGKDGAPDKTTPDKTTPDKTGQEKTTSFKLNDGTYKLDAKGRLCETISNDGSSKRTFKYDDPADANKVTTVVMNDKTEFQRNNGGNNWTAFDVSNGNRTPVRTSPGGSNFEISTSPSGVVGIDYLQGKGTQYRGTSGTADLAPEQVKERQELAKKRLDELKPPAPDKKLDSPNDKPLPAPAKVSDINKDIESAVQKATKDGTPVVFVYTGGNADAGKLADNIKQNAKQDKQPAIVFVTPDDLKKEQGKDPAQRSQVVNDLLQGFKDNNLDPLKPHVIIEKLATGPKGAELNGGVMYKNALDWVQAKPENSAARMKAMGQGIAGTIEKLSQQEPVKAPDPEPLKPKTPEAEKKPAAPDKDKAPPVVPHVADKDKKDKTPPVLPPVLDKDKAPPVVPPVADKDKAPPIVPPVADKDKTPPIVPPVADKDKTPPIVPPVADKDKTPPIVPPVADKDKTPPVLPPVLDKEKAPVGPPAPDKTKPDKDKAGENKPDENKAKAKMFDLPAGKYTLDPSGNVETCSKDGLLKRLFHRDKQGQVTSYIQDSNGEKTKFERSGPDTFKLYSASKDGKWAPMLNTDGTQKEFLGDMQMDRGIFKFTVRGQVDSSGQPKTYRRGPGSHDLDDREVQAIEKQFVQHIDSNTGKKDPDKDKPQDKTKDKEKETRTQDGLAFTGKEVKLPDGTYKRDEEGRITETVSADGSTKHVFKYGDPKNPNLITSDMVNDTTEYRYLGNVTIGYDQKPYEKEGFAVNSYSTYSKDGQLTGNWAGVRSISPNGVFSVQDDHSSGTITHLDASGNKLDESQRKTRETDGIWPSQFDITMDNGTKYLAKLKGVKLDSLIETRSVDGKSKEITWSKNGDIWSSDEVPPVQRKKMELRTDSTLRYDGLDNVTHIIRKDGSTDEIIKGVTHSYDNKHVLQSVTQANGDRRTLGYSDNGKELVSIADETKTASKKWQRQPGTDNWTSGDKTEVRKDVKLKEDGGVEYKLGDNTKLDRPNFTSVLRDKDGQPLEMTNQKGDTRSFTYEGEGPDKTLREITEIKNTAKGEVTETWKRKDGSDDFATTDARGREKIRKDVQLSPEATGDYTYKSKDGAKDIVARLGSDSTSALSESVEEARDSLLDEMKDKIPEVNYKRLGEMMKNFENRMVDRAYLRKLGGITSAEAVDDEAQKEVQNTYDNMRQMVARGDDGTFYDQKTRVRLAENFLYHAMEPTTVDQGPASNQDATGHGTCWISSGQIWGLTQHPGAMADYLKQVCLDGQVTTKNGGEKNPSPQTFSFSNRLLTFDGNKQESKWTIESSTQEWRDEGNIKTQIIGDRSPVSQIFDYTLPILSGARREFDVDGGLYDTANIVGRGNTRGVRDILKMVTDDVPVDTASTQYSSGHLLNNNFPQSMAEKGTVLTYEPGHLRSQTVRKVDNEWYLIQDDQHGENNDKVLAKITDIKRWAQGDRTVERPVSISALELLHKKKYTGSGDADRIGPVTPRKPSGTRTTPVYGPAKHPTNPRETYLPAMEFSYH